MSSTIFCHPDADYKRNIDPIGQYIKQAATFISQSKGITLEAAYNWVKEKTIKEIKDPKVTYYIRQDNGDRFKEESTLKNYIYETLKAGDILAPSFTTYLATKRKRSLLADYSSTNIKKRKAAKNAEFVASNNGDTVLAIFKGKEQIGRKLANNAVSGAHAVATTIIYNRTSHSTLTSNCRVVASFGNSNNEKLITGNRHYWKPSIALNNIVVIIANTDFKELSQVMLKYDLVYPTVEDLCKCIKYSTDLYWEDSKQTAIINDYISKLDSLSRAAVMYVGDLWHIKELNQAFMYKFITQLSTRIDAPAGYTAKDVHAIPEPYINLAHQLCTDVAKGMGKDYDKMTETGAIQSIVPTGKHIATVLEDYSDFIKCFFLSKTLPTSVAYIPTSLRRAVIVSDTDSTIFTTQEWVKWYTGNYDISIVGENVAATVAFLASQTITHILTSYSRNAGIDDKHLHAIDMKSEFYWPVFISTGVAKHYMALCAVREGNVFDKFKREIKGVHLISSNLPKILNTKSIEIMDRIMDSIYKNDTLSLSDYLYEVADLEREIIASLLRGDLDFYRLNKIKTPDSYSKEANLSPYQHHLFWKQAWEYKYGAIEEPTYSTIKIPTTLHNKTALADWLLTITDPELRYRVTQWLKDFNKDSLPTMYLSSDYVKSNGIPEEIRGIINTRSIISDLCNVFYIVLESLGYYKKEGLIISDSY